MITTFIFQLTVALLAITWLAVGARLLTRIIIVKRPGLDDAFLFCAQVIYMISAVLYLKAGYGSPRTHEELIEKLTFTLVAPIFYIVENIFFRLSLGLFFLRFLLGSWQRRYVYCSIGIYTLFALAYFFSICILFGDPHRLAEKMMSNQCQGSMCGKWHVIGPMSYIFAASNTFIDVTFAILPVVFIRNVVMPIRTKISICALLGLGLISGIAATVRLAYIHQLNVTDGVIPTNSFIVATTVEQGSAIIGLSLSALRPLFELKWDSIVLLPHRRLERLQSSSKVWSKLSDRLRGRPSQSTDREEKNVNTNERFGDLTSFPDKT